MAYLIKKLLVFTLMIIISTIKVYNYRQPIIKTLSTPRYRQGQSKYNDNQKNEVTYVYHILIYEKAVGILRVINHNIKSQDIEQT